MTPGAPIKRTGPKAGGWTILRHRTTRAEGQVLARAIETAEIGLPLRKAREMIDQADHQRKWAKLVLESIEDFEAVMANPEWLVKDKAARIEMIVGTMHSRITNLKNTIT